MCCCFVWLCVYFVCVAFWCYERLIVWLSDYQLLLQPTSLYDDIVGFFHRATVYEYIARLGIDDVTMTLEAGSGLWCNEDVVCPGGSRAQGLSGCDPVTHACLCQLGFQLDNGVCVGMFHLALYNSCAFSCHLSLKTSVPRISIGLLKNIGAVFGCFQNFTETKLFASSLLRCSILL